MRKKEKRCGKERMEKTNSIFREYEEIWKDLET